MPEMWGSTANEKQARRMPAGLLTVRVAGLAAACLGALALLGWLLGLPLLATFGEGLIPMAPSSALLIILFGVAVSLGAVEPLPRARRMVCGAMAAAGTLVVLVLFVASIHGVLWKAESLGLSMDISFPGIPIGQMSPVSAICLILTGVTFLAILISAGFARLALGVAGLLLASCVVLFLAYVMDLPLLYGGGIIPPAVSSMLSFAALGVGLWALAYRQMRAGRETDGQPLTTRTGIALVLIFLLFVISIFCLGTLYFRAQERHFHTEVGQQLSSVANLKVDQLVQWRRERLGDGILLFKNAAFASLVRTYFGNPDDVEAQQELRTWLRKYQEHLNYNRVSLYDLQGVERMSFPEAHETPAADLKKNAAEAVRTRQVVFEDFYRNEQDHRVYLSILVPIFDEKEGGPVTGILALGIDPEKYLYPFIKHWPTPSRTAETLLVRREGNFVLFLNELRFQNGGALSIRCSMKRLNQPAVRAAMGYEGIVEGPDYRDVPVLAAVRAIPDSPWFLISRMDIAEINSSLREREGRTIFLAILLLFGSAAAAGLIWRQHSTGFYREKLEASERLRREQSLMLTLMDNLPDYIYFKDTESRFLRVNPALARLFELGEGAQVVGKSDADFFTGEHVNKTLADEREIMRTGRPLLDIEERETWPDGTESWVLTSKLPLRDGSGRIIGTSGISTDITKRKLAEEALRKTGVELLEKNAELERFLYTASHDLKSPVVTVKTFLGYLKQDMESGDAAQVEKDMRFISTAADKMGRLLDELLGMSRIGRVASLPVSVTFRELVDESFGAVAGRIAERGVTVSVNGPDITLCGDRLRLAEIWQNLVDNACKFMGNQAEPHIEIGVETGEAGVVFHVRDNGIGVDPRYQTKVFGLFEKLDPKAEGTGIGLALVKRIVEVYGGRIWVESDGPGRGSNFLFTLPGAVNTTLDVKKS
jgi:PAS domain S-box-containing protein